MHSTSRISQGRKALNGMMRSDCYLLGPSAQVCIGSDNSYPPVTLRSGAAPLTPFIGNKKVFHFSCHRGPKGFKWDEPQRLLLSVPFCAGMYRWRQ